jgi:hypothetical protein
MPTKYKTEDSFKVSARKSAIERVLRTPEQAKKNNEDYNWYWQVNSSDPEILGNIFRKEWSKFEACIDNERDKARLKKKFGIK